VEGNGENECTQSRINYTYNVNISQLEGLGSLTPFVCEIKGPVNLADEGGAGQTKDNGFSRVLMLGPVWVEAESAVMEWRGGKKVIFHR
jgi:hypothetical protein